jgi:hypothetical protein
MLLAECSVSLSIGGSIVFIAWGYSIGWGVDTDQLPSLVPSGLVSGTALCGKVSVSVLSGVDHGVHAQYMAVF